MSATAPQDAILAIDDETGFLFILKTALESHGYFVHTAASPIEALEFYSKEWRDIRVVLLDFWLPEMTGDSVFERLQELNPQVRVMLLTGYDEQVATKMLRNGLRHYVQKPFCLKELAQKVRDTIDAP